LPIAAPFLADPIVSPDFGVVRADGTIGFGTGNGAGVNGGKDDGGAHEVAVFVLSGTQIEGGIVADGGAVWTGGNVVTPCATTPGAAGKAATAATTKAKPKRPTKRISTSRRRISLERCGKRRVGAIPALLPLGLALVDKG